MEMGVGGLDLCSDDVMVGGLLDHRIHPKFERVVAYASTNACFRVYVCVCVYACVGVKDCGWFVEWE